MLNVLIFLIVAYSSLLVLLFVNQRKLLYYPDIHIESPQRYGLSGFEDIRGRAEDGTELQLWYKPAQDGFPTVAYFHGNAGHLGNRALIFDAITKQGFGLLALSYRGYGKSAGAPTEQGIYADARAALAWLMKEKQLPANRILLYGESLGSGVAVQMATEYVMGGLILEAPYTAVSARAAEIYFYIPVRLLIRDRFDSLAKIGKVTSPILLFHGELDETIPVAHGRALLQAATAPKQGYFFPQTGHSDFDSSLLARHILEFAKSHRLITH